MSELGINVSGLLTQLVSFTILLVVLVKLLYRPVTKMLNDRTERIRESLEAAERAKEQASSAARQVEKAIAEARGRGPELIVEARDAANRFRAEPDKKTRSDDEQFLERAKVEIDRDRADALEQVRSEFASLAISAAEQVIEKSLDDAIHRDLIENVLNEGLEQPKN